MYVAPPVASGFAVPATKGFVKDVVTYMVTDDLVVKPMSTISCIALLNKFNVKDVGVLEELVVSFGMEECAGVAEGIFGVEISTDENFQEPHKSGEIVPR
ncbi:hypothetical protein P3S67_009617 [Capsicum chacoense]